MIQKIMGVDVEKSNGDMNVFSSLFIFLKGREGVKTMRIFDVMYV